MKNIHILPTDKPSMWYLDEDKKLQHIPAVQYNCKSCVNIHITSPNKDINENDYIITKDGRLVQVSYLLSLDLVGCSKVILTTDPDLIKDGVQSIDDGFLGWFKKNPSCEEVRVLKNECNYDEYRRYFDYKIIVPSEEPKKDGLDIFLDGVKWKEEQDGERYTRGEVLDLLIDCKNKFGGSELQDYVSDDEVEEWFNNKKR